jgi:tyrosinase
MADNAYTAFDPVFWSHHAMIDYVLELWIRGHAAAMYTASFPLQPFVGTRGDAIDEADPRAFVYTTIGDLAKDSRSLGFDFEPLEGNLAQIAQFAANERLFILFDGVRCTQESYAIDIFLNEPDPTPGNAKSDNPHYVMRMMRIGMGIQDDKGRCITKGVTRVLDASKTAHALDLKPGVDVSVALIVTDVTTKRVLSADEVAKLPGFSPKAVWSTAPTTTPMNATTPADKGHSCCH